MFCCFVVVVLFCFVVAVVVVVVVVVDSARLLEPELAEMKNHLLTLRLLACWLRAGYEQAKPASERKFDLIAQLYNGCLQLVSSDDEKADPLKQVICQDATAQQFMNQGDYHFEVTNKLGFAQAAWEHGIEQGALLTAEIEDVMDANRFVARREIC